jgi:HAD superfamily hydrolase (TIGR01509 family)
VTHPATDRATLGPRIDSHAAVLWDMDGTLVDTEPCWTVAELELAARYGGTWSADRALDVVGFDLIDAAVLMREGMGIDVEPEQIVEELLDSVVAQVRRAVPWRPGARELLAALRADGVPCALVTMSYTRFVEPILAGLPADTFAAVVTGDTVERGKPHPEPYLTAAAALGLAPGDCIAVEDSNTGAKSAESAGCLVLVVENHVPVLAGERRIFADSLVGVDLGQIWADYHR